MNISEIAPKVLERLDQDGKLDKAMPMLKGMEQEERDGFILHLAGQMGLMEQTPDQKVGSGEMTLEQDAQDVSERGLDPRAGTTDVQSIEDPNIEQEFSESAGGQVVSGTLRAADNALVGVPSKVGSGANAALDTVVQFFNGEIGDDTLAKRFRSNYKQFQDLSNDFQEKTEKANPYVQTAFGISGYAVQGYGVSKAVGAALAASPGAVSSGISAIGATSAGRVAGVVAETSVFDGVRNLVDAASKAYEEDNFEMKQVLDEALKKTKGDVKMAGAFSGGLALAGAGGRAASEGLRLAGRGFTKALAAAGIELGQRSRVLDEGYGVWKGLSKEAAAAKLSDVRKEIFKAIDETNGIFKKAHEGALSRGNMLAADAFESSAHTLDIVTSNFVDQLAKGASGSEIAKAGNVVLEAAEAIKRKAIKNYGIELADISRVVDSKAPVKMDDIVSSFQNSLADAGMGVIENGKLRLIGSNRRLGKVLTLLEKDIPDMAKGADFKQSAATLSKVGAIAPFGKSNLAPEERAMVDLWENMYERMKGSIDDPGVLDRFLAIRQGYKEILGTANQARSVSKTFSKTMVDSGMLSKAADAESKGRLISDLTSDLGKQSKKTGELLTTIDKINASNNPIVSFDKGEIAAINEAFGQLRSATRQIKKVPQIEKFTQALKSGNEKKAVGIMDKVFENTVIYNEVRQSASNALGYKTLMDAARDPGNTKLVNKALKDMPSDIRPEFSELIATLNKAQRLQKIKKPLLAKIDKIGDLDKESADVIRMASQLNPDVAKLIQDEKVLELYMDKNPTIIGRLAQMLGTGRSMKDEVGVSVAANLLGLPFVPIYLGFQALKDPAFFRQLGDSKIMNPGRVAEAHNAIKAVSRYLESKKEQSSVEEGPAEEDAEGF